MRRYMMKLVSLAFTLFAFASSAMAQGETGGGGGGIGNLKTGAIAVAIAALGGALGDGKAISAACEGTARNPGAGGRIFTMMILGLALIETLVLLAFVTALIQRT